MANNSVLNKSKSAILPLFNSLDMLSSASDKAKLFAKIFSKNSNLDDSGISLPVDCVLVVILKNCESELSYILADLFDMSLKESCFPDCWKIWERSTARNNHPLRLLSVVSKVFEKLVNNRIVDHLEKWGLLSDF